MKKSMSLVPAGFPLLSGLLLVYLLLPLAGLAPYLSLAAVRSWLHAEVLSALAVSTAASTMAIVVLSLLGVPLAYLLARRDFPGKGLVNLLVQIPLAVPPVVSGILLLMVFGPYAPVGSWLASHGFLMTDSLLAITAAQLFVASPFVIIPARAAFEEIDASLEQVAATLGKSPQQIFRHVVLPLAWPAILSGITLSWVRALGEFGATAMVAYHPYSLPVLAWVQFQEAGLDNTVPLVLLMLLVGALGIGLAHLLRKPFWRRPTRFLADSAGAACEDPAPGDTPFPEAPPASATGIEVAIDHAVGDFQLAIRFHARSNRVAILGPSGSGKSMTLKALAGLLVPEAGHVAVAGRFFSDAAGDCRPAARRVGYVPQHFALFPHMTVWQNIAFAQEAAAPAVVASLLELLGLARLAHHYPNQLSYGQQQRVALARALARQPDYLLLDEPFASLDTPLRLRLRRDLLRLLRQLQLPVVLVTHDPDEAFELAEEIVVIANGRVLQQGTREAVFNAPCSPQVAELLGIRNTFLGEVVASTALATVIRYQSSSVFVPKGDYPVGAAVHFFANPHKLALAPAHTADSHQNGAVLEAVIDMIWPRSNGTRCVVAVGEGGCRDYWEVDVPGSDARLREWRAGDRVQLFMPGAAIHLMPATESAA